MKIAIGMGIAALAYVFLMVFSFTLPSKEVLGTMSAAEINAIRVTPWIMIGLYFILYSCRIVHFSFGLVICIQGSSSSFARVDARLLVGCDSCG